MWNLTIICLRISVINNHRICKSRTIVRLYRNKGCHNRQPFLFPWFADQHGNPLHYFVIAGALFEVSFLDHRNTDKNKHPGKEERTYCCPVKLGVGSNSDHPSSPPEKDFTQVIRMPAHPPEPALKTLVSWIFFTPGVELLISNQLKKETG